MQGKWGEASLCIDIEGNGVLPNAADIEKRGRVRSVSWRRSRRGAFLAFIYAGDLFSPLVAFVVAYQLRFDRAPAPVDVWEVLEQPNTQLVLALSIAAYLICSWLAGLHRIHQTTLPLDLLLRIFFVSTTTLLVLHGAALMTLSAVSSRVLALYMWLVLLTLALALRLSARAFVLLLLCIGIGIKKIVLVGSNETTHRLHRLIREHPEFGYRVMGLLSRGAQDWSSSTGKQGSVVQGSAAQIFQRVDNIHPDLLIITDSTKGDDDLLELMAQCAGQNIEVRVVPEVFDIYSPVMRMDRMGNIPMLQLRSPTTHPVERAVKRLLDCAVALALLPILGALAGYLKLRADRLSVPLLEKRSRAGLQGDPFQLYTFNSELWRDQSGTPHRRGMRWRVWVSHAPQILNVLRGEMSMVGPSASELDRANHFSSWEKRMLSVRPGVVGYTGLNESGKDVEPLDRLAWDVEYIDHQSFAFDLSVLVTNIARSGPNRPPRDKGRG